MTQNVEDRIKEAFGARVATAPPPREPDWLRAAERSSRRAWIPVAALVTAAIAIAPFAASSFTDSQEPDRNGFSGLLTSPMQLVNSSTVVRIGRMLPGGKPFLVDAFGSDGTVLGRSADNKVWQAGVEGGKPVPLDIRAKGQLAAGPGFITWAEPGKWDLKCRTADGRTTVISPQSVGDWKVREDRGALVWDDVMGQAHQGKGCSGMGTFVGNDGISGDAVAFSYPTLFLSEPTNKRVFNELDLRSNRVTKSHPLPIGVKVHTMADKDQEWYAAANSHVFAWVVGDIFRVNDRRTWKQTLVENVAKPKKVARISMTAGSRIVAYSAESLKGEGESLLYDAESGQTLKWSGAVYAAGDWLLWRDGADYRLGRVR